MEDFAENDPTSWLIYLDCNNLYGASMSEFLPVGGFEWLTDREFTEEDIRNYDPRSNKGLVCLINDHVNLSVTGRILVCS